MSNSGKLTPLGVNTLAELNARRGFTINPTAAALQGVWTPSSYTQGSVTGSNLLQSLTESIPRFYDALTIDPVISVTTYRRLLLIGAGICPALGNSRPSTFKQSYPGFGSWQGNVKLSDEYPPRDYPISSGYSYVYNDYGQYAWITGWPGRNGWQKSDDEYKAAYLPPPGNTSITDYDEYFKNGFIGTVARQAYYEMFSERFDQYYNICNAFSQNTSWRQQRNAQVATSVNSRSYMTGTYSNMNDLTTNNIAGVNQAFRIWGTDLQNTGRAIDLSNIHRFGTPSVLLFTLVKNNAFTDAVKLALQYSNLTSFEIDTILNTQQVTPVQEKKIYNAFTLVQGNDLYSRESGVMYNLNCRTQNLESLADLLNLKKLFPNSYNSFTVPQYRTDTPASIKSYYFIYTNGGVNPQIKSLSEPLSDSLLGVIPEEMAYSCGAFSVSMQQIKNIMQADIEKVALSIIDLELTNKGLPLINTATGVPVNIPSADYLIDLKALGSGNSGTYRQIDFYGAASGWPYEIWYNPAVELIKKLGTAKLGKIYSDIYALSFSIDENRDSQLNALITAANTEIQAIYSANTTQCEELNYYWDKIGNQMFLEQRAWPYSIPKTTNVTDLVSSDDIDVFVRSIEGWAIDNGEGETAQTLERISNLATLGGQSMVAMMREARNAERLNWPGVPPDNDVSGELDLCSASAVASLDSNGSIEAVFMTAKSNGYTNQAPPNIYVYPPGSGAELSAVIESDGSISGLVINNSGANLSYVDIVIDPPPQCVPINYQDVAENIQQQAIATLPSGEIIVSPFIDSPRFVDNPQVEERPLEPLPPPDTASPTVLEAIEDVTKCNCDCWNL